MGGEFRFPSVAKASVPQCSIGWSGSIFFFLPNLRKSYARIIVNSLPSGIPVAAPPTTFSASTATSPRPRRTRASSTGHSGAGRSQCGHWEWRCIRREETVGPELFGFCCNLNYLNERQREDATSLCLVNTSNHTIQSILLCERRKSLQLPAVAQ